MKDADKKPNVRVISPGNRRQERSIPVGRSTRTESRRRSPGSSPRKESLNRWRKAALVFLGMALLVAFAGLIFRFVLQRDSKTAAPLYPGLVVPEESIPPADPADWKGALPSEIAESFTAARTHAERLKLIANPDINGELMAAFFNQTPAADEQVSKLNPMSPVSTDNHTFERYHVMLEDGSSRLLCVLITEEGAKVDFSSYARYCSESWGNLLSGKATSAGEIRVFIEKGAAYLYGYSDDTLWSSYIATSPDLEMPLYFHAPRDSGIDGKLSGIVSGGKMRATLSIRSTADAWQHRQFEVTDVLAAGWVK